VWPRRPTAGRRWLLVLLTTHRECEQHTLDTAPLRSRTTALRSCPFVRGDKPAHSASYGRDHFRTGRRTRTSLCDKGPRVALILYDRGRLNARAAEARQRDPNLASRSGGKTAGRGARRGRVRDSRAAAPSLAYHDCLRARNGRIRCPQWPAPVFNFLSAQACKSPVPRVHCLDRHRPVTRSLQPAAVPDTPAAVP
jgi:hypothetical protein